MSALNDVASMGRRAAAGELSVVILVLFCVKSGGAAIRLENEPPLKPRKVFCFWGLAAKVGGNAHIVAAVRPRPSITVALI